MVPALSVVASGVQVSRSAAATSTVNGTSIPSMPLQEFVNDDASGRLWNSYDQSQTAQGPTITGRPSALVNGTAISAFAREANGDLGEYANDDAGGRLWNSYDLTQLSGGSAIVGDPAAELTSSTSTVVFAEATSGDLVEFSRSGATPSWTSTDLTKAASGPTVAGDPAALIVGSALDVFVRSNTDSLVEFSGTIGGQTWTWSNLTTVADGSPLITNPGVVLYGTSSIHVYGSAADGHLTEYVNDGAGNRAWNAYDLTTAAAGPTITGQPSGVSYGLTVHVYVRSTHGDLIEFVNDDSGGRLWNAYDLTTAADGPAITGDPGAVMYDPLNIQIFVQAASGDLVEYVNDHAGGRLWNSYDQSDNSAGPAIGGDPTPVVYGSTVHVFSAGPPAPLVVQQIVSLAEAADQYNAAVVENPPGSNCNPYTAYWGRGSPVGCAPGLTAEEWCSDFAQWVWAAAGVDTTGINGWSYTFVTWGQAHSGAWSPAANNAPQPGDAVIWGDLSSQYGAHVGIVVGVSQGMIDVVSGNAGPPMDAQGDVDAVWDSGYFDPTTSDVDGYPIIGYVSPVAWNSFAKNVSTLHALSSSQLEKRIATQDGGK